LKHRTKEEIAALILEAIVNSNRPTPTIIMYKVYVGYVQLKAFLSSMLEKDLIEYNKQDRFYTITEKVCVSYRCTTSLTVANNN